MNAVVESYKSFLTKRIHVSEKSYSEQSVIESDPKFLDESLGKQMKSMTSVKEYTLKVSGDVVVCRVWARFAREKTVVFYVAFLSHLMQDLMRAKDKGIDNSHRLSKNVFVDIYPLSDNKVMPRSQGSNTRLTALHVHSGYTLRLERESHITVYRKEELLKVLTHEFIHAYGLDQHIECDDWFFRQFGLCQPVLITESYTEFLACCINCVMFSMIVKQPFEKCFELERKFVLNQARKVYDLVHLNLNRSGCEETQAIAYYIIKAIPFCMGLEKFERFLNPRQFYRQLQQHFGDAMQILMKFKVDKKTFSTLKMTSLDILEKTTSV
jgi:hypothetical protein